MAALTDAMKWYNLGGLKAARLKFHFKVEIFSAQYTSLLQIPARLVFDAVRTIELPKYSIETEVANAWNVRQPIPTKINFEPLSISFTDTLDNRFQTFVKNYMNIISGSFAPQTKSMRKGFDDFGIKMLESGKDCPIDRIVITRFYGTSGVGSGHVDESTVQTPSVVTLWRPKIVDVQHDTLDYSASEAITWQVSLRYESVTYSEGTEGAGASNDATSANRNDPYAKQAEAQIKLNEAMQQKIDKQALASSTGNQIMDQVKRNQQTQEKINQTLTNAALAKEQSQAISVQVPGGAMKFSNQAALDAWQSGKGSSLTQTQLPGGAVYSLNNGGTS